MTTLTLPAPVEAPPERDVQDAVHPLRWTLEEYYRLAEQGFFAGRRVMLIEGEIIVMSPQNEPHTQGIILSLQALQAALGKNYTYRPQVPLELGQASDPEPDIAVIAGSPRSQPRHHPTSALLVVEVADTSLAYDTSKKASLYAAAGITDYWVVDLVNNRLVVFRDPQPDPAAPHGHSYFARVMHSPTDSVAPLAAPNSPVRVADLLP